MCCGRTGGAQALGIEFPRPPPPPVPGSYDLDAATVPQFLAAAVIAPQQAAPAYELTPHAYRPLVKHSGIPLAGALAGWGGRGLGDEVRCCMNEADPPPVVVEPEPYRLSRVSPVSQVYFVTLCCMVYRPIHDIHSYKQTAAMFAKDRRGAVLCVPPR